VEEVLCGIWGEVLGLERVGVHDNFFDLGGDSILSIQVLARARQAGLDLAVKQLFEHPTVAELAAAVGTAAMVQAEQGPVTGRVPLTPIQHWFFEQELAEPHHFNQALLLEPGPGLEPDLLEQAIGHLLGHHDALRLRFVRGGGGWEQTSTAPGSPVPLSRVDLSGVPEEGQGAALERAAAALQASLDLERGPLLRAGLFDLGHRGSRLLLVVHHLAVDRVSWGILLEDLERGCEQLRRGGTVRLGAKTTSFKQWSELLTEYAQSAAVREELDHWLRVSRLQAPELPVDFPGGANTAASEQRVWASLTEAETRALLRRVPITHHVQVNEVLLTALLLAFTAWTRQNRLRVDVRGHGREDVFERVDLSRTVGWFMSIFPVVLEAAGGDPREALQSVREQVRRVPGRGLGYGLLRYLRSEPEIARQLQTLPRAQVSFNYLGQLGQARGKPSMFRPAPEPSGPTRGRRNRRPHRLEIDGGITHGRLAVSFTFDGDSYRTSTMSEVAGRFAGLLRRWVASSELADAP